MHIEALRAGGKRRRTLGYVERQMAKGNEDRREIRPATQAKNSWAHLGHEKQPRLPFGTFIARKQLGHQRKSVVGVS